MTFIPTTSAATTVAAAAAAAERKRRLQKEEEQMTRYRTEELEGWEFKIVRAATRKFRRPEVLQRVCEEEARAGWEMLEKFDDSRIRFKRRIDHRAEDRHHRERAGTLDRRGRHCRSVLRWGKRITSRRFGASARTMVSRSIPIPRPPVGGMPYSRALRKSSSMGWASASPCAAARR